MDLGRISLNNCICKVSWFFSLLFKSLWCGKGLKLLLSTKICGQHPKVKRLGLEFFPELLRIHLLYWMHGISITIPFAREGWDCMLSAACCGGSFFTAKTSMVWICICIRTDHLSGKVSKACRPASTFEYQVLMNSESIKVVDNIRIGGFVAIIQ